MTDTNKIAGSGQHSHQVPTVEGLVVEIRDGNHAGTSVWLSSEGDYVFVDYDLRTIHRRPRCVLVRGLDIESLEYQPYGCDLDSPDGLVLLGLGLDEAVPSSDDSEILWDSADPS